MKNQQAWQSMVSLAILISFSNVGYSHFTWLTTDDQGHAEVWFGESINDRTYHMPEAIEEIQVTREGDATILELQTVDDDHFIGLRSDKVIDQEEELFASVIYGLYQGMKLTYHVEHLPLVDSKRWSQIPRPNSPYQTVVSISENKSLLVKAFHDGKPITETQVQLFGADGELIETETSDERGMVEFESGLLGMGLHAVMISHSESEASGSIDGVAYTSTADYLTSTFYIDSRTALENKSTQPAVKNTSSIQLQESGLAKLPEELTSFGAAVLEGNLYTYGGHTGEAHSYSNEEQSDRFWRISLTDDSGAKWQQLTTGPRLQGLALVAHGDRLIRVGGFTALNKKDEPQNLQSQRSVAAYSPKTNQWSELAPLPEPRSSLDAAVLGDQLYVIGGWQLLGEAENSQWHSTAWSLDLSDPQATWKAIANQPFQRRALSVAAHQGKIYAIGGMQADQAPVTIVNVYDPVKDTWSSGPSLPGNGMSGFGSSSFATGGKLYVTTMDGFAHQLNEDGKGWTTVLKLEPARFFHRMIPRNDSELLLIGGADMGIGKFTQIDSIQIK